MSDDQTPEQDPLDHLAESTRVADLDGYLLQLGVPPILDKFASVNQVGPDDEIQSIYVVMEPDDVADYGKPSAWTRLLESTVTTPFAARYVEYLVTMLNAFEKHTAVIDHLATENTTYRQAESRLLDEHAAQITPTILSRGWQFSCGADGKHWPCPTILAWHGRTETDGDIRAWKDGLRESALEHAGLIS